MLPVMADDLISQLTFKELHLFPRAVFGLGVFLIVYGTYHSDANSILSGVFLFFGSIGINILFDLKRAPLDKTGREALEKKWLTWFYRISFSVAGLFFIGWIAHFILGITPPPR